MLHVEGSHYAEPEVNGFTAAAAVSSNGARKKSLGENSKAGSKWLHCIQLEIPFLSTAKINALIHYYTYMYMKTVIEIQTIQQNHTMLLLITDYNYVPWSSFV